MTDIIIDKDNDMYEPSTTGSSLKPQSQKVYDLGEELVSERARGELIEAKTISNEIARLRANRAFGLTGFYCNDGKDYHVIVSKKDKGYFQALNDIEKVLLGKEKSNED